jgi:hypothetical protein
LFWWCRFFWWFKRFLLQKFFFWLNIDQANTLTSFVYKTNIEFFYSWTFQHLFYRFDRNFSLTSED